MDKDIELTTIYVARGQFEAEIVRGRLEVEGIPSMLRYESAGLVYGILADGLGEVEIQVPSSLAQLARQILSVGLNSSLSDQPPDIEP
jgi:hypothetical protein